MRIPYLFGILPLFLLKNRKKISLLASTRMRSSHTIFFCLLTTALCLVCKTFVSSSNSPTLVSLLGRRSMKDLSMLPSSLQQDAHQKIKVHEETKRDSNQPGSFSNDEFARLYNEADLVYHTDYHGVTTHPNPTPKHHP